MWDKGKLQLQFHATFHHEKLHSERERETLAEKSRVALAGKDSKEHHNKAQSKERN